MKKEKTSKGWPAVAGMWKAEYLSGVAYPYVYVLVLGCAPFLWIATVVKSSNGEVLTPHERKRGVFDVSDFTWHERLK